MASAPKSRQQESGEDRPPPPPPPIPGLGRPEISGEIIPSPKKMAAWLRTHALRKR